LFGILIQQKRKLMRDYIPKILIIDDIKENLVTLEMNMRSLNVEIISAQSGKEALIQIKQHDFAVMIVDIQMPEMNGFQTAERIRQGRRNRHTPIIFLTAVFHDQNSIYQGYRSGAVDYITKPFNREILLSKVKVFIDLDRIKSDLSASKKQFQSIVQDQTDLICRTDNNLNIQFANRALLVALAKTFESINGKDFLYWVSENDQERLKSAINTLTPTNAVVKIHHSLNASKTRQVNVSTIFRAIFDNDYELMGYQMVMRDMTAEIKSQEDLQDARKKAEHASKMRSQFIANMSHEIRTPMNSIVGMIDILFDSELDEDQHENVEVIKFSADKLLNLLNDIIDFSKIDSDQVKFVQDWFVLSELIQKTVKLLELEAKKKKNELKFFLDPAIPKEIKGDHFRLGQILINLLNNALKFTKKGTVELRIEKQKSASGKVTIRFTVLDNGVGIPENDLNNIFKVFDQGDPEITRKYGGSGLGLAISKSLCEKMGGTIKVSSKVGKGTNFNFTLTFDIKETAIKESETNNFHILVVEDNILNQRVVGTTLQRNGYTYDVAENGQAAVDKFINNTFDLIIMDIQMPVMDGYEATQKIRIHESEMPDRKKTKIIALTANATKEDHERCLEVGMDDYMTKPFRFKELSNIIAKLLG
jgi:PAS domain S-box-containing protein